MTLELMIRVYISELDIDEELAQYPSEFKLSFIESMIDSYIKNVYSIGLLDDFIEEVRDQLPERNDIINQKVKRWWKERSKEYYNDGDKYLRYCMNQLAERLLKEEHESSYATTK